MFWFWLIVRIVRSFSFFFVSVILGVIAMGFFWYLSPDRFVQLQRSASVVRDWIAVHAWSARAESIILFLLEDRQVLLIGFVLATRLLLGLLGEPLKPIGRRLKARFTRRRDKHSSDVNGPQLPRSETSGG